MAGDADAHHLGNRQKLARLDNPMKLKRVLVTGATGFIGRQTLVPLLDRGFDVHAVFLTKPVDSDPHVIWHKANLLDTEAITKLCGEVQATHLLHLAWYVDPKDYKTSPENKRWVEATRSLVRAFRESGGTRAVLAGTCMEYDVSVPQEELIENVSPVKPTTVYSIAKNETHLLCERYANENSLSLAWGRIFNLYGPHEAETRLVPHVIHALSEGKMPRIDAGGVVMDYSYVLDTAGAFAALLDSDVTGSVNIASGSPVLLKDIAVSIADILCRPNHAQAIPEMIPENQPARIVADVRRLREEVQWTPRYDLRKGLEETVDWWK